MSLVQKYINENKRLYVIYVDMMKCFDSVYRNALWLKIYKAGIEGKLLRIIKSMYENVKSCVKHCSSYSDYFNYAVGLRQGEVMSPLLFSLFVEDLEMFLQNDVSSGLSIDDIVLILLLFADDMAIIGKSPAEVQKHLDLVSNYCKCWGLKVNTDKTKIMVFRKRGRLLPSETWTFEGQQIEVVNDFNYLGTVFNYTGNFNLNQEYLCGKALKAMNILFNKCKEFDLKPKTQFQLFDAFVGSILNYACEIWGKAKSMELERIHLKFCKRLLNVKQTVCNAVVYGELGRYPLFIHRYVKMVKYWFKLIETDNIILKSIYIQALNDCQNGRSNWVSNVKLLLDTYGFSYVFNNPSSVDVKIVIPQFKTVVIDTYKQEWFRSIENSSVLDMYRVFKSTFVYENYLDLLPKSLRHYVAKLRSSSLPLRIQTGRYAGQNIPRNERFCLCCNELDIEDEYHFVCKCPLYVDIRKNYLKKCYYNRPSVYKFHQLLNTTNKFELIKLAKFVKEALILRNNITNAVNQFI
ncbi:hypothetical protein DPMN_040215 [Dreissena polymorpha]|uniref:Reverse transcriptase domain-containing protein n=1 Tax=Dreissena polymorpha TaxID=45954 RepID=A0A9D4HWN5_DREPO|nr:hypothetical protein DPMN_040215 [Dreissena polymorpha]